VKAEAHQVPVTWRGTRAGQLGPQVRVVAEGSTLELMRSTRVRRLCASLAACVLAIGAGLAIADRVTGGSEATAAPQVVEPPTMTTSTTVRKLHRFTAAEAVVPELVAFAAPNPPADAPPVATAANPTHEGFPLVVSVIDASPDAAWLNVRLPQRPNGTTGWVRADEVRAWVVPNRIEIDLSDRRLTVFDGDSSTAVFTTDVAVGVDQTPTPTGDFFIDIVNPLDGHKVYGWGQLSVSGFSDVLERFAGGIGQIAIHGWNDDSVMGTAASNGCVRMRNDDIAHVAELAPLGTPVRIVE